MFERREAEIAAKKEKQVQAEKEHLQRFYEQRIALDKKYYDEKERRMKQEAQLREQNLRFAKKEQLVPIPTSGVSQPTFAKLIVPPSRVAARTALSVPRMTTTSNLANIKLPQSQSDSTNMGQHMPLLMATPRLSTALTYATTSVIPDIQTQTLQPITCVADTKLATASTAIVCTPTSTVPYCTTASNVIGNTTNVDNLNVASAHENVAVDSTSATNIGIPQNIPQNVCQSVPQLVPMVDTQPKFVTTCCPTPIQAQPTQQPVLQPPQPQMQTFVAQSQTVPTVVVRPPTTPKLYKGDASYKAYREYFERLSVCNGWTTPIEKAQNLIISLDSPAAETVRGLEIKQDQDYETI